MKRNFKYPYGWQLVMRSKRKQKHVNTAYQVFQRIRGDLCKHFTEHEINIIAKAVYFHDIGYDVQVFQKYDYHEITGAEFLTQCPWVCGRDTYAVATLVAHHGFHSQYQHMPEYVYDFSKLLPYNLKSIPRGLDMLNIVDFCDLSAFENRIVSSLVRYNDIHKRMVASGTDAVFKLELKERHIIYFSLLCEMTYGIDLVTLLGVEKYTEYKEALS